MSAKMSSYEEIEKKLKTAQMKASALEKRMEAKKFQIESLTLKNEALQLELDNRKAVQADEETKKENEKRKKQFEKIKQERHARYLHAFEQDGFTPIVCRYFLSGNCKKGSDCTYLHSSDPSSNDDSNSQGNDSE